MECWAKEYLMNIRSISILTAALVCGSLSFANAQSGKLSDPQIAHVAYTAGVIDAGAGKLALKKSRNQVVREFAQTMVRDHEAVNMQALALVKKLNVTPQDNEVSKALSKEAKNRLARMQKLKGAAFDRAYIDNEVAYHKQVNGALENTLIPDARNPELKSLLETGLKLFKSHQKHAEHASAMLR